MRAILTILLWSLLTPAGALTLTFKETDIPVEVISAGSQPPAARILWLPSEYGLLPEERALAQSLAEAGLETWRPDLFEAWFLPTAPSSLSRIPSEALGRLLQAARTDGLPLYVIGANRGALLALRAWQAAQRQQGPLHHAAIILINPNLYVSTPRPGAEARYHPETRRLNAPVYLFQAELSPWRWRLKTLTRHLESGGSDVFIHLLYQVRDRFYFRPDALPVEQKAADRFAGQLRIAMHRLIPWMATPRHLPAPANPTAQNDTATADDTSGKTATLTPYTGEQPPPLVLQTFEGETLDMRSLRGRVVLVNFWASWCPPCVHEMPSMAALKRRLKDAPFEILAVNLAEDRERIAAFLRDHPVNFPILLDPTGTAVKQWRIFAYPSSFLLDRTGRVRYAAFGALDWNGEEAVARIRQLLAEPAP